MFERFSREARGAVMGAQQVAVDAASRAVDGRHLVVALAEGIGPAAHGLRLAGVDVHRLASGLRRELALAGLDADALASIGIDLDAVRERADAVFGRGALDRAGARRGRVPFDREAKKALELALREAIRLTQTTIDGRHLLLGVLRAGGAGRQALGSRGIDLDAVRDALEHVDPPDTLSA